MPATDNNHPAKRQLLAVIYACLIFGSITCPVYTIALGVLSEFALAFAVLAVPSLLITTSFLFAVFIKESNTERCLRQKWPRLFQPIFMLAIMFSFFIIYGFLAITGKNPFVSTLEYWFYLCIFVGGASLIAFVVIFFIRPSRLENAIGVKLKSARPYQDAASGFLIALLIFVGVIFYQFYWYIQPPVY